MKLEIGLLAKWNFRLRGTVLLALKLRILMMMNS